MKNYDFSSIIPSKVVEICTILEKNGYVAGIVGGSIRDILLGFTPNDYDITTSATPEDISRIFNFKNHYISKTLDIKGAIEHGVTFVLFKGEPFEIATFRKDGDYVGHHCEVSYGDVSLEEDLKRRDFTINAMVYRPYTKELIGVENSREDIENHVISTVGNAIDRFNEDPLRIMRAFRFQSTLGFNVSPEIIDAAKQLAPKILNCSYERIQKEFSKLIYGKNFKEAIISMYECGVMDVIMPEFRDVWECTQENPHHYLNVGEHTLEVMANVPNTTLMRWAALFHDFGKPATKVFGEDGICHFPQHPAKSEIIANDILRRFRFDNDFINMVCVLVKYHDSKFTTEKSIRKFISKYGENLLLDELKLRRADVLGQHPTYQFDEKMKEVDMAVELVDKVINDIHKKNVALKKSDLALRGKDIMEMGYGQGPIIGQLLNELFDYVLEFPEKNTKEDLIKFLEERKNK